MRALTPFAPHLAEELWSRMGESGEASRATWPVPEARWLVDDEIEVPLQVNGKLRATVKVSKDADEAALRDATASAVEPHLAGKTLVKVVVVPGRLVNYVVR